MIARKDSTPLKRNFPVVFSIFFFLFLFSAIFLVQKANDNHKKSLEEIAPAPQYILPESLVKQLNFGFRAVLADYYWISIIQNSGLSIYQKDLFLKYHYNISVLDPQFAYPYTFAVLWLPTKNRIGTTDAVVPLAERGMREIPNNWEIPFYLAFQYQIVERSFDKTGKYLAIAASKEDVPLSVMTAYSGYLKRLKRDDDLSVDLLQVAYETAKTPALKKIIGDQLLLSYVVSAVNSSALKYKEKYGVYPKDVYELAEKKFLNLPADYDSQFSITLDIKTGKAVASFRKTQ
jgi:hypothetical protein